MFITSEDQIKYSVWYAIDVLKHMYKRTDEFRRWTKTAKFDLIVKWWDPDTDEFEFSRLADCTFKFVEEDVEYDFTGEPGVFLWHDSNGRQIKNVHPVAFFKLPKAWEFIANAAVDSNPDDENVKGRRVQLDADDMDELE